MQTNQGLTLDRYLEKNSPLAPAQAARIALQLAQQLGATAGSFVIHPGRILVEAKGAVKLLPPAAEELALPSVVEYPAYSSPEEIHGQQADVRSGLYSLGCTLFQLLAGEPPYASTDPKQILHAHLEAPIPDVRQKAPAVPLPLAELTSELLAKDPELRVQTPEELIRRLKQSLLSLGAPMPASSSAAVAARSTTSAPRSTAPAPPVAAPTKSLGAPRLARGPAPTPALAKPPPARSSPAPGLRSLPAQAPHARTSGRAASGHPKAALRGPKAGLSRTSRSRSSQLDDDFDELGDEAVEPIRQEKRSYPFTIAGVVLGFLVGLLLMGKYFENAEAKKVSDRNNQLAAAREETAKRLNAEKEKTKGADADMQRRVAVFLGQVQGQPPERQVMKLEESLTNFANNHYGHRVVEEYLKAWAAGGGEGGEGGDLAKAYAEQKAAAEKLYAEGKIALAYLKINENVRQFSKRYGAEIDEHVNRWGEEVAQKWKATLARAQALGDKGDHQGVMDLLREALSTYADGDEAVSKLIRQELAAHGELAARLAENGGKSSRSLEEDEAAAKNKEGEDSAEGEAGKKPKGNEPEFEDPEKADSGSGSEPEPEPEPEPKTGAGDEEEDTE